MITKYKPLNKKTETPVKRGPGRPAKTEAIKKTTTRPIPSQSSRQTTMPTNRQSYSHHQTRQTTSPYNLHNKNQTHSTKTFTNKKTGQELRISVVGGMEEVGRNMTIMEYDKEIIIIDMGLQFPEEDMYGIDYIIPNIEYLKGKESWVKGVLITHGHYDHIGGIPHIMGKIGNPPMFMGKFTQALVQKRVKEYKKCPKLNISQIDEASKVQLGKYFKVEFLRVNHSIPDCFAMIVHTPLGIVVHTGDFKIDYSPVNDKPADLNRIAQIGGRGVMLLMSDSTDATSPGYQVSESKIGEEMFNYFEDLKGRIIVGTFASQLSRVQKLLESAEKLGRKVYLQGRSMNDNVEIAHQIGYLKFSPKLLINDSELKRTPDDKLMIIGTGGQGETNAFLMKVATGEHRTVRFKKGDTVVFSSSVIPGNERSIQNLRDVIVRQGAQVIHYKMLDVHAGGHAKQEDLKLMMRLIRPKFFMPIEANHFMLRAHADLALQVGIPQENIFIPDNGQIFEISKKGQATYAQLTNERMPSDYVMVDGLGVGDVSNIVLRDRKAMAEDGMIVAIATIDSKTGDLIGSPDIISRGFIYMKDNRELIQDVRMRIKKIVKERPGSNMIDDDYIKNKVRNDIGQFLFGRIKRRPMVLPVVIKV